MPKLSRRHSKRSHSKKQSRRKSVSRKSNSRSRKSQRRSRRSRKSQRRSRKSQRRSRKSQRRSRKSRKSHKSERHSGQRCKSYSQSRRKHGRGRKCLEWVDKYDDVIPRAPMISEDQLADEPMLTGGNIINEKDVQCNNFNDKPRCVKSYNDEDNSFNCRWNLLNQKCEDLPAFNKGSEYRNRFHRDMYKVSMKEPSKLDMSKFDSLKIGH